MTKNDKKPFNLDLHRDCHSHKKNLTLMPCLHSISNNKDEEGLWFLWQPKWATIQDLYKCSNAEVQNCIKSLHYFVKVKILKLGATGIQENYYRLCVPPPTYRGKKDTFSP